MASSGGGGGGGDPWAWLGLLKWSLSYSDGTHDASASAVPMSEEDRAFLTEVMKEGVIDENALMKTILKQVTEMIDKWKQGSPGSHTKEEENEMQDRLQKLRDIVEQIDYARAFAAMKGLNFLLGCVQEREYIPRSMRGMCLGILATMCQHNPPVQKELLELGAIGALSDLFFVEHEQMAIHDTLHDTDGQLRARIIQAISANVRSHDLAEAVFSQLEQAPRLLALGLTGGSAIEISIAPLVLRQRTLFFLKALLTSDSSTRERVERFSRCVGYVVDAHMLEPDDADAGVEGSSPEVRELALDLVEQVLEQKKSVNVIMDRKDFLAALGVSRVTEMRNLTGEEREYASTELEHWEKIMRLLARATRDEADQVEDTNQAALAQ